MTARTDQGRDGKLIELEGDRVGVRFERRLTHPPERVWRAITEPEDLEKWFPARPEIAGERRVGAELQFTYPEGSEPPETGEITEHDPPRLFAFTWRSSGRESQLLRFELEPEEDRMPARLHPRAPAARDRQGRGRLAALPGRPGDGARGRGCGNFPGWSLGRAPRELRRAIRRLPGVRAPGGARAPGRQVQTE